MARKNNHSEERKKQITKYRRKCLELVLFADYLISEVLIYLLKTLQYCSPHSLSKSITGITDSPNKVRLYSTFGGISG